jgi:hypothetical protein
MNFKQNNNPEQQRDRGISNKMNGIEMQTVAVKEISSYVQQGKKLCLPY